MSVIYPKMLLSPGAMLDIVPDDTKTGGQDGPMSIIVTGTTLCAATWLSSLAEA